MTTNNRRLEKCWQKPGILSCKKHSLTRNKSLSCLIESYTADISVDAGRKANVYKTFRRRTRRLLNVLCAFNLRPVFTGIIHSVTRRNAKKFLLALVLHSLTAQKKVIEIVNKLGYCISYPLNMRNWNSSGSCSTVKRTNNNIITTETKWGEWCSCDCWVDRFDCIVETQPGSGAINWTHLVVFQEKTLQCSSFNTRVNNKRDKRRSFDLDVNDDMFQPK